MEWFTEPVWLGNYIVARWEALLFVYALIFVIFSMAIGTLFVVVETFKWIIKRIKNALLVRH